MKKILAIAVALIMVLALVPAFALADTPVTNENDFLTAMAVQGNTVVLGKDITITATGAAMRFNNVVTLDLNGYTLTFGSANLMSVGEGNSMTIKDSSADQNGKIVATSYRYNVCALNGGAIVLKSGTITAEVYGIYLQNDASFTMDGGNLFVNNGEYDGCMAISGNGSLNADGTSKYGNTQVTINNGTIIAGHDIDSSSIFSLAIYQPQTGTVTINGGTLIGGTGIVMLAGTLNMTGGTVSGLSSGEADVNNSNGTKGDGSAILLVANDDYAGGVNVNVTGGTLISDYSYAMSEREYRNTNAEKVNIVSVAVENATVKSPIGYPFYLSNITDTAATVTVNEETVTVITSGYGDSEVRANASPTFIVTIPAIVDFGTISRGMAVQTRDFDVSIADAVFADGMQVVVGTTTPVGGFKMTEASGSATLAYEMSATTFTFTNALVSADHAETIKSYISTNPNNITIAGEYSDLLVFSIEYKAVVIVP